MKSKLLFAALAALFLTHNAFAAPQDTVVVIEKTQADWAAGTLTTVSAPSDTLRLDTVRTYKYTFTNCGQTGNSGPSQTQINTAYAGTSLNGLVTGVNGMQLWKTPQAGMYRILAAGSGHNADSFIRGAILRASFCLPQNDSLLILVAQMGASSRGGNGGTFVVQAADTSPVIIAGGAAGMRGYVDANNRGSTSKNGHSVNGGSCNAIGGSDGYGGIVVGGGTCSGAGGGFLTDGAGCGGGKAFKNGGMGGVSGVFNVGGFGGGASVESSSSPGGGGGYSGGSVHYTGGTQSCAGGGGSYIDTAAWNAATSDGMYDMQPVFNGDSVVSYNSWRTGHGLVTVDAAEYVPSGNRVSPVYDISTQVSTYISSAVEWNADTNCSAALVVETNYSLDGGSNWNGWSVVPSSGSPIPGLLSGVAMDNARIQARLSLSATLPLATPEVYLFKITVINDSTPTGIRKPEGLVTFGVHPNPFEHSFTVGYMLSKQSTVSVRLHSMLGQSIVVKDVARQDAGKHSLDINAADLKLSPGVYFAEILIDGKAWRERVVYCK